MDAIDQAWQEWLDRVRARTPARLLQGRAGSSYCTQPQLELREAHAAAVDAVRDELDLHASFGDDFCTRWGLFEVGTEAASKAEYLLRPDKGRRLNVAARASIAEKCRRGPDVQILVGDGLSVAAVRAQVPRLLPLLVEDAQHRGWTLGNMFVIRHCRVGVMNDIGELLAPKVLVMLIGERPGLATAESLSAYMAFEPKRGHTDADRNLVSNIHPQGTDVTQASARILEIASAMMQQKTSGTSLNPPNLKSLP